MTKNHIELVLLSPSLLNRLKTALKQAPDQQEVQTLSHGLTDLQDGSCHSLMLEVAGTSDTTSAGEVLHAGDLTIDRLSRRVKRGDEEISLTPKEFDILYFLAKNEGEVFTKEQIYQAVWDRSYLLDDSNIMAFIRKIRKKIEPNPDAPQYILTIWGIGYKFNDSLSQLKY